MSTLLQNIYWQNAGKEWLLAILIFVAVWLVLKAFKNFGIIRLKKISKRTTNDFDDVLIEIVEKISIIFYFVISLYVATRSLILPPLVTKVIYGLFVIGLAYEVIQALGRLTDYGARKMMSKAENGEAEVDEGAVHTISIVVKILLWVFGVIMILGNLGVNIASLLAGLGIGGIAVALAVQSILGDIFSSFSILFDKPFKVGDFILIGDDMGVVEKIGIKTTRITTLQGQQLVVSNKELTSTRINNYGRMQKRRVAFDLGVIYETPKEKLEKIPELVKKSIESVEKTEFDRSHFKKYGDFALIFESVYYVNSADYNEYMDINQQINFNILDAFQKEGIEFAYPTQVEYQKKLD